MLTRRRLFKLLIVTTLFAVYYTVNVLYSKDMDRSRPVKALFLVKEKTTPVTRLFARASSTPPRGQHRTVGPPTLKANHSTTGPPKTQVKQYCKRPDFPLWPPSLHKYFNQPLPLECGESEQNWVYVENATFQLSSAAIKRHGAIRCDYTGLYRGDNDESVSWGETLPDIKNGSLIKTDFFKVYCKADDRVKYQNIHIGIVPIQQPTIAPHDGRQRSLGLNVLMIGFDSVSRHMWMRNLPKTYKHLVKVLGAVVLEGYNIVGDATTAALLPMFTGKHELELPESRKRFPGAKSVDGHPWIWKEYKKLGYVTQFAEDSPDLGAFTLRLSGFRHQPVDHYMRTYYLAEKPMRHRSNHLCVGSLPRHVVHMNYARDLYRTYPLRTRKFSFMFHTELTHGFTSTLQLADDDLLAFLKDMDGSGYLNDTVLIMMADHGPRFSYGRETVQGKYEERNPFMSFRFPPSFEKAHPEAMKNLRTNAHRLSTPYDIHATLREIINYSAVMMGDVKQRSISLLSEIPESRTCEQAAIAPHWCTCLSWTGMDVGDGMVKKAAAALVSTINSLTASHRDICEPLTELKVTRAVRYAPNEDVLKYKGGADYDKYEPDLTDKMTTNYVLYQVTIRTSPGKGLFEGTVTHQLDEDTFQSRVQDISRINKYGNQAACVEQKAPHLRKYCYCKGPGS